MIEKSRSNEPPTAKHPRARRGGGRKRDAERDEAILRATIDMMVEVGFETMTIDMVAARARAGKGAVYRRWPSKSEMMLDAIALIKRDMVDLDGLPDTGSLRGDMLALFAASSPTRNEQFLRTVSALTNLLGREPSLASGDHGALIEPWVDANRILIRRALARGEGKPDADIETLSHVIPSVSVYRSLIQRLFLDRDLLTKLLDSVLLPALGIAAGSDREEDRGS